ELAVDPEGLLSVSRVDRVVHLHHQLETDPLAAADRGGRGRPAPRSAPAREGVAVGAAPRAVLVLRAPHLHPVRVEVPAPRLGVRLDAGPEGGVAARALAGVALWPGCRRVVAAEGRAEVMDRIALRADLHVHARVDLRVALAVLASE